MMMYITEAKILIKVIVVHIYGNEQTLNSRH